MDTITDKKWLCILKRDVIFLTHNGERVRGLLAFTSDKLSLIRAALRDLGWHSTCLEGVCDGCVYKRGEARAAYVATCDESGNLILLRAHRYIASWRSSFPAALYVDHQRDVELDDMLELAKDQVAAGWLVVDDII